MSSSIALFGNPNTGKTSLFNNLTGSYEYVGNWSGVTVEKKVGMLRQHGVPVVDLPGIYSLRPLSRDEGVATEFLLTESFSAIVNIVDASQLKRNLHLTVQLLEFGKPLIMALNMIDVAEKRGIKVDAKKLSQCINAPVIPVIARTGKGTKELVRAILSASEQNEHQFSIDYGADVEVAVQKIGEQLPDNLPVSKRWLALQFLEGNKRVHAYLQTYVDIAPLILIRDNVQQTLGCTLAEHIYKVRDKWITNVIKKSTVAIKQNPLTLTEKIDAIVTNKYLGLPIFLLFMYIMFMLTFDWLGTPLADLLDQFFSGPLTDWLSKLLSLIGASPFIKELVLSGIVSGVGGVLVFVPQIFILFFFISLLEDSGYMARVAMVMDRFMEAIGLNGKAFIPMIIGFGCNVPGVMAARTIEQPKERLLTILLLPFMSCSARLPVYALFAGTFFAKNQAIVVFSLYVLGIVVALGLAKIFSSTLFKNESSIFVIELPPYRMPQALTLWRSTWDKGKGFIRKAGTFIFGGSVAIWLLTYVGPKGIGVSMDDSFLAVIGGVIAPILAPLGFGTWQAGSSLITGFLAKEVVVSTMNIIYHAKDMDLLQGVMAQHFTPLSALSFMTFVLLYVPCLATVATIRKETGSRKWTFISIGCALSIAYVISFVIYQGGTLLGFS
ncbi:MULTISPECIES: ferrous iron transport protein B [unclassified Geobacillus]|uniref:Ferrous iron transport protein B n=1 Tax=Geobacillus sp. (strain WCH70) TaxID=471223 RepID=C5DAJ8_GEOSW|nr:MULTISPECIES: ferrous iron transport protein B [unclassified Geobacillus]PDM40577.1 ferrous iron transport protein B [Parageobacillus yumthangensis]RDV21570.1 ferrous iron transport protein B [Parageobacillus toebii]TXK90513.1 ferrous iron transport protein B [Parageobacillus sp. SY1]PUF89189.1 ferrous iron transport protein B [Geobacillus sp. LYN3]TXK86281.1 ferrous iron transport protein B [Geobacillus sp. AYS3]